MIKDLTFTTESVMYPYWTLAQCIKIIWECKQYPNEDLATFYKRWYTNVEVLEEKWGTFVPTDLKFGADPDEEKKKLQACMFLYCVNWHYYGKVIDELNNAFVAKNKTTTLNLLKKL